MKLHEMIQFKNRIEKRKSYFDLPDLPEKEWNHLLQRARIISVKDVNEKSMANDKLYSFMCSARLSFALSIAIIILSFSLLFFTSVNKNSNNNTASNNVNVPVVNVSNNSFI